MATKATLALTTMAAAKEGKQSSTPSEEAITAIDDVLSMANDMSFFGNSTRSYKNSKDNLSGSFCTIPVKYSFKDRDTRIRAENVLRDRCKVNCSTLYPIILRECIKQVIDDVKKSYKDNYVGVSVDTSKMGLKVSRRPPKESGDSTWMVYRELLPIPDAALDISARKVPDNFRFSYAPLNPSKGSDAGHSSPRQSRKDSFENSGKSPSSMFN